MGDVITGIDFAARRNNETRERLANRLAKMAGEDGVVRSAGGYPLYQRIGETIDGIPIFVTCDYRPDETAPSEYVAPDDDCA